MFLSEYISPEDIVKYDIKRINEIYFPRAGRPSWTVDHGRNIYLRYMEKGRGGECNQLEFTFFWKGTLLFLHMEVNGGSRDGVPWLHYRALGLATKRLSALRGVDWPSSLMADRSTVIEDLRQALVVNKILCVFPDPAVYKVTISGFEG